MKSLIRNIFKYTVGLPFLLLLTISAIFFTLGTNIIVFFINLIIWLCGQDITITENFMIPVSEVYEQFVDLWTPFKE